MSTSIMRRKAVTKKTGLPPSTMYGLIADGLFPKPLKLGARSSGWVESEVEQWIDDRIAERDTMAEI